MIAVGGLEDDDNKVEDLEEDDDDVEDPKDAGGNDEGLEDFGELLGINPRVMGIYYLDL